MRAVVLVLLLLITGLLTCLTWHVCHADQVAPIDAIRTEMRELRLQLLDMQERELQDGPYTDKASVEFDLSRIEEEKARMVEKENPGMAEMYRQDAECHRKIYKIYRPQSSSEADSSPISREDRILQEYHRRHANDAQ